MPWKECLVMDERVKFVARRLAGEPMVDLCREAIASTVIPLPSPITPVVFCSPAKRFLPPGKTTPSLSLSGCFKNVACRLTSAATMVSLLHRPMLCSTSANLPSGGFASALALSVSSLAILNRMAATNPCISP